MLLKLVPLPSYQANIKIQFLIGTKEKKKKEKEKTCDIYHPSLPVPSLHGNCSYLLPLLVMRTYEATDIKCQVRHKLFSGGLLSIPLASSTLHSPPISPVNPSFLYSSVVCPPTLSSL